MSCSKNDIDRVRALLEDRRHGFNHHLDAFIRRKQSKCQYDGLIAEAQFRFGFLRFFKGKVGYSVWYHFDLVVRNEIDKPEKFSTLLGHHYDLR